MGFLKHSIGLDINNSTIISSMDRVVDKKTSASLRHKSLQPLDHEFHVCKNGQCKFKRYGIGIVRCDGHVDCADNSDEENCESCPENSVRCLISGVPTCVQEDQMCTFSPEKCWSSNNTELPLTRCTFDTALEKFAACKNYLDKYFRKIFGEDHVEFDGESFSVPKESYRNKLCRGNEKGLADNSLSMEEALNVLPPSIKDFKFLNYKQYLCQDKVNYLLKSLVI